MCVIAYKPEGTAFMPESVLRECFRNNPDGAGFMFPCGGKVHIRKGFMDFNGFWDALETVRAACGDGIPYVMHFRISTQGGVNRQCCHPFPLSSDMARLKELSSSACVGIAHNGIIRLTSDGAEDYSDTMRFITDYMTLLVKGTGWWRNPNVATALEVLCGSKLAVMGADSHVELIGDFIGHEGCFYSNSSFDKPKASKVPASWYDDWGACFDARKGRYKFDEDYCPFSVEGDTSYCEACSHRKKCSWVEMYKEHPEEFGLLECVSW